MKQRRVERGSSETPQALPGRRRHVCTHRNAGGVLRRTLHAVREMPAKNARRDWRSAGRKMRV